MVTLDRPLVVLLAGLSGSGKSTFAPYLAKALDGNVLDSDDLFDSPRVAVGNVLGIGTKVVDEPAWRDIVHGRLMSVFLAMASVAATSEHPVVAVSPWTGFRQHPDSFNRACVGLDSDFQWVIAKCEPETRYQRICDRGREMDASKVSTGVVLNPKFMMHPGSVVIDTECGAFQYPALAEQVAARILKTTSAMV
jgi:gluconate kinase